MTREDAIYWIKNLAVLSTEKDMPQIEEALNMAVEALADRKTEPQTEHTPTDVETMSCEECKWWLTDGINNWCELKGYNHDCQYKLKTEPRTEVEP